jgi:hypothetical protein
MGMREVNDGRTNGSEGSSDGIVGWERGWSTDKHILRVRSLDWSDTDEEGMQGRRRRALGSRSSVDDIFEFNAKVPATINLLFLFIL